MVDKILFTFILSEFLFLLTGALLIGFSVVSQNEATQPPTLSNVTTNLLLDRCPLTAATVNAVFIFITFLFSVPAMAMPMTRGWLKFHGFLVVVCAMFTLVLGLDIWFTTLKTRTNLATVFSTQPASTQSLVQQSLGCCGYINTTDFVTDTTCTSAFVAAGKSSCVGPFSTIANNYLDVLFTAAFGIVGVDVAVILAITMLLEDRKEKERYRHIDEKNGASRF